MNLRKTLLLLATLMCIASLGTAATLRVSLDGSQPYMVIQTAINASVHGDTVLVYPGRYYENIRFLGKNITLASLELITGDLQYKYSTILDGNHNGSVIQIRDGESAVNIRGFTITNGSGFYDSTYDETYGGGLLIGALSSNNQISLVNCIITKNSADNGGGMQAGRCNLILSGNTVRDNVAKIGGGIKVSTSSITQNIYTFDPVNRCNIYDNKAALGCEMYFYLVDEVHVVVDTFTVATPTNFYAAAIPSSSGIQNPYTFEILHSVHEEVNHDLYVAPWGDDNNSGLSEADPLRTIFHAVYNIASDPDEPKTIHLANGLYSTSANQQYFPIPMKNWLKISGASKNSTIIDIGSQSLGFSISPFTDNIVVEKLSVVNSKSGFSTNRSYNVVLDDISVSNIYNIQLGAGYVGNKSNDQSITKMSIRNVNAGGACYGIYLASFSGLAEICNTEISGLNSLDRSFALDINSIGIGKVQIDGCRFHDNTSTAPDVWNAIMQIGPSDEVHSQRLGIEISNSAFYNNHQSNPSFMAYAWALNDTTYIRNCTFAGNSGGSAALAVLGNSVLENNLFWNPQLQKEVIVYYGSDSGTSSQAEFDNNCIRSGQNGIYNMSPLNQVIWKLNNIASDPMFTGGGNAPYRLSSQSPLIDRGMQAALWTPGYDAGGNERVWDGNGDGQAVIDIGAYEYQPLGNPVNLTAQVWQQQVLLTWQMSAPERSLSGYRVYRNGEVYADILEPACTWFRDYSPVNDTLSYYVVALYGRVESEATNTVTVIISGVGNADELAPGLCGKVTVSPNPFTDLAVVNYELDKATRTEMKIYNLKGQLVRTLYSGTQGKGEQHLAWEGCDDHCKPVASGIYFLQMSLEGKALRPVKMVKW